MQVNLGRPRRRDSPASFSGPWEPEVIKNRTSPRSNEFIRFRESQRINSLLRGRYPSSSITPVGTLLLRSCSYQLHGVANRNGEGDLRAAAVTLACVVDSYHASAIVEHRPPAVTSARVCG